MEEILWSALAIARCLTQPAPCLMRVRRNPGSAEEADMADPNVSGGTDDPHNLGRFVRAQEDDYEQALSEIRSGRKRSHWMWYVFPQYAGLGLSSTSRRYAIQSIEEAEAYLGHPVLGPRLVGRAEAAPAVEGRGGAVRVRDLRVAGRHEAQVLRDPVCLRIDGRVGVRAGARQVLPGRTRWQDAPPARHRARGEVGREVRSPGGSRETGARSAA